MFDIGFWEMAFIGVVALIVIGPERLPGVARTVGHWVGKGRRMLNEVKTDIKKEIKEQDLQDLKNLKQEFGSVTSDFKSMTDNPDVLGVKKAGDEIRKSVDDVKADLKEAGAEIKAAGKATGKKSVKKAATKKTATKKATVKKAATKKATAKKTTVKKTTAKKTTARETTVKKATAKKAVSKKPATRKVAARKTVSRKATAKKATVRKKPAGSGKTTAEEDTTAGTANTESVQPSTSG